jgi:hypothetical protein
MKSNSLAAQALRHNRGNMLLLCVALFAVIIVVVAIAFGVYFLFHSQKSLLTRSEGFALKAAQQLNANDCAGRLNNLQCRSRELVYLARQMCQMTESEDLADFAPLAEQVMNQSRDGAKLVESERKKYVALTIANLRTLAKNEITPQENEKQLANMSTYDPQVVGLKVGTQANLASNVEPNTGLSELYDFDMENGYIKHGKLMNLYRSAVNLKLPGPDGDLDFELAPLPAPVKGTVAPLRLASASSFKSTMTLRKDGEDTIGACQICPSAVQVTMTVKVKENILTEMKSKTEVTNTAFTNGAGPDLQ